MNQSLLRVLQYIYFWTKNIYIVIHVANIFLDQEYILIATKLLN